MANDDDKKGLGPKLVDFNNPSELRAAIEQLTREVPHYIAMAPILAQIRKANYDALIAEGFTPEQALDLCKYQAM